jgi:phage shock protein PspC (stress-responsive transcriptional regulator)
MSDVEAIKGQLGEPEAFLDEAEMAHNPQSSAKRLFRDLQHAWLGGVASGIAAYLDVSVAWIRLVMILMALVSFGGAVLLYAVLWIVVPPVRSASDRLQLEGKPVTVPSLQAANSQLEAPIRTDSVAIRLVTAILGIGFSIGALGSLAGTVVGAAFFLFHDAFKEGFYGVAGHTTMYGLAGLFVVSGVMLASLCTVLAYASFTMRVTNKIVTLAIAIVLIGLVTFGLGLGTMYVLARQESGYVTEHTTTTMVPVKGDKVDLSGMTVDAAGMEVVYTVSDGPLKASLQAFSDQKNARPVPLLTAESGQLKVGLKTPVAKCQPVFCGGYQLFISGPVIKSIAVLNGKVDYLALSQPDLAVKVAKLQTFSLNDGTVTSLDATVDQDGSISTEGASVDRITLTNQGITSASFGSVTDLAVTNTQSCPAMSFSEVDVNEISGALMVNGVTAAPTSTHFPCLRFRLLDPAKVY